MAGWFLECDLIELASNIIQVFSRILLAVPYTESTKIGQTGNGQSTNGSLSVLHSLIGKDPVTILQCEIGSSTIIVDLVNMPDLDTDSDSFIIIMDSISNQLQKL